MFDTSCSENKIFIDGLPACYHATLFFLPFVEGVVVLSRILCQEYVAIIARRIVIFSWRVHILFCALLHF